MTKAIDTADTLDTKEDRFACISTTLTVAPLVNSDHTLRVWVALLALSDLAGCVEGNLSGLASLCKLSTEDTTRALSRLAAPDEYSPYREFEGRRIEVRPNGWYILNYRKYLHFSASCPKCGARPEHVDLWPISIAYCSWCRIFSERECGTVTFVLDDAKERGTEEIVESKEIEERMSRRADTASRVWLDLWEELTGA